jgi:hypothetical protein
MKLKRLPGFVSVGIGLFAAMNSVLAQTWTPGNTTSQNWEAVASSADGSRLIAGGLSWFYGISTNSGGTWITNTEPQFGSSFGSWSAVAASADGTEFAGVNFSAIWISTNSGVAWFSNNVAGVSYFASVALSADGKKIVAVDGNNSSPGLIYVSTNSGVTVTPTLSPTNNWKSVASSADGTKLVAATTTSQGGLIYASTDSGLTWAPTGAPTNNYWAAIASSADGTKLVAASSSVSAPGANGNIYTSTNFGTTWTSNNVPNAQWQSVASSADGTKLVAVAEEPVGWIYTSTNSGTTWMSNSVPNEIWHSVTSSADGGRLAAAPFASQSFNPVPVYTLQTTPAPQLHIAPSSNAVACSWLVPSTNFVLQQTLDLTTANWVTLTNKPALNFTNLQDQATISPSNTRGFFRLVTQ